MKAYANEKHAFGVHLMRVTHGPILENSEHNLLYYVDSVPCPLTNGDGSEQG